MTQAELKLDNYTTSVSTEKHEIIADEPTDLGGKDKGMTPMDLLEGALASCTAITLKMYANRKEWKIENISVHVSSTKENNKTSFKREISVTGELDDQQLKRLLSISNACPVHKVIESGSDIETSIQN